MHPGPTHPSFFWCIAIELGHLFFSSLSPALPRFPPHSSPSYPLLSPRYLHILSFWLLFLSAQILRFAIIWCLLPVPLSPPRPLSESILLSIIQKWPERSHQPLRL
ncbi:MAG: hypothetical protein J3Q66DRAFT_321824 [Benniella sp.]|nr:MAG: hypothetical protein J3Q66DRAFT_321824 [Benniella sp.]